MSERVLKQLSLLLANPDVSDKDFHATVRRLRGKGLEDVVLLATRIREEIKGSKAEPGSDNHFVDTKGSRVQAEIERLLTGEAKLTARQAVELLWADLEEAGLPPKKQSLRQAIELLIRKYGDNRVLSTAHRIRNEKAHELERTPWPLRGSGDSGKP